MSSTEPVKKRVAVGALPAMVFEHTDVSFYMSLQNLIGFVMVCMKEIMAGSDVVARSSHIELCAREMERLCARNAAGLDPETSSLVEEFVGELRACGEVLKSGIGDEDSSLSVDVEFLLISRYSNMRWVAVCILEELKEMHRV